ncbi:unnamed protein product [Dracunculus medinensis]|uniref:Uncharacterized protein n=1 Tax=Dracunculus medinensis TaxID=318479 RepID=A0A0N4UDW2_DRAME|nr:unnamed protein product [Dracunculus medinensis]
MLSRSAKNWRFQQKAIKYLENVDRTKVPVSRYSMEQKRLEEAQNNQDILKEVHTKHENLIENMNKFTIVSTNPPERTEARRPGPTRENEWSTRYEQSWEFGFYEPPADKIPKGKLTFREALDLMKVRSSLEERSNEAYTSVDISKDHSAKYPAIDRIDKEKLQRMWQYFRAFEHREQQQIVRNSEIKVLQDAFLGYIRPQKLADVFSLAKKTIKRKIGPTLDSLMPSQKNDENSKDFLEEIKQRRFEEKQRLNKQLENLDDFSVEAEKFPKSKSLAVKSSKNSNNSTQS